MRLIAREGRTLMSAGNETKSLTYNESTSEVSLEERWPLRDDPQSLSLVCASEAHQVSYEDRVKK